VDASSPPQVIVVTGGDPVDPSTLPPLPSEAVVVAADSGIDVARRLGLRVDHAVGDFDSVTAAGLDAVTAAGAHVDRHPVAKDATDLELALLTAAAIGVGRRVLVIGGHGGRLDHHVANVLVLAARRFDDLRITAWMGTAQLLVVRDEVRFSGRPGETVSLLAVHGPAHGVTTAGLRWRLDGDTLDPGSTRGISNVLEQPTATVTVDDGVLVVIRPDAGLPAR
jgi:thiamine pyrophosphokinase